MTFNPAEQGQGQYQQGQPASGPFQQQAGYQPGQAGQAPPWQQGGQQQPRPPARPSPFASVELSTWLALTTSGLGLLTWLLMLFGSGPINLVPTLGAAVLALFVLLPGEDKAPKVLPFAGGVALLNGLLSISGVAQIGFGADGAIGVVAFILVLFQMVAGVGAVLFEYKLVSLPQPAPKPPKPAAAPQPQQPQQQAWQQSAGQYPQQPQAQQAPQQQAPQQPAAQPWQQQSFQPQQDVQQQGFQPQSGQQAQQQGGVGNFDPNLFDSGKFQPVNPQQQGGSASGGDSGTKQFSPPETNG